MKYFRENCLNGYWMQTLHTKNDIGAAFFDRIEQLFNPESTIFKSESIIFNPILNGI